MEPINNIKKILKLINNSKNKINSKIIKLIEKINRTKVDSKHSFTSFQQLIEGASRIRTNDIDVRYGIGNFLFFISLFFISL